MAERNYTVGRGELHFSLFKPGTQTPAGYRYLGNSPEFSVTFESETQDHYNSDRGIREKDASVTIEVARSGQIALDEVTAENIATFLFGTAEDVADAGATVTAEQINAVKVGHSYQLGETASNPVGAKKIVFPGAAGTLFTVKDDTSPTPVTFVAGTDYVLDPDRGLLKILDGGSIDDGDNLRVTYTRQASTRKQITSGSEPVNGALKFITFNPIGLQYDWVFPWITLRPNGDFNLKGDDWQQIPYAFDILRKQGLEAVYVNGAPYTP